MCLMWPVRHKVNYFGFDDANISYLCEKHNTNHSLMKSSIHAIMLTIGLIAPTAANADTVTMRMSDINPKTVIMPEIYGQFAEHLGSCIYGGLWVGPDSPIPNTSGYRNDVLQALRDLKVPVMRWPGGCFADEYHRRDGRVVIWKSFVEYCLH